MRKNVSIIIVSFNCRDYLSNCLRSIYLETDGINFEVIIVDNGSDDGTVELIKREYPEARLFPNRINLGFAAANNQGIKLSDGEYVLLLNPDTEILEGAVQKTYNYMKSRPSAGVVGCLVKYPHGKIQPSVSRFPSFANSVTEAFFLDKIIPRSRISTNYHVSNFDYTKDQQVDCVSGAYLMFRRDLSDKIGLLDENFFMYSEETDFCYRAKSIGTEVWFTPSAEIVHHWGGMNNPGKRSIMWVQRSQLLFYQKHYTGFKKCMLLSLKHVGLMNRVIVYFIIGLFTFDKSSVAKSYYYLYALSRLLISGWQYDREFGHRSGPWKS